MLRRGERDSRLRIGSSGAIGAAAVRHLLLFMISSGDARPSWLEVAVERAASSGHNESEEGLFTSLMRVIPELTMARRLTRDTARRNR